MAYRLEGKDIVISGFEQGIADTPYQGIADMRNIEIISVPMEGMVGFKEIAASVPPVYNAVAYTAQNAGDTITVASTAGLYNGCAIVLNTNTATGLSTGIVYYVGNITATTFQLYLMPAVIGTPVAVTADGSGTLTTYQYGRQRAVGTERSPQGYFVDKQGAVGGGIGSIIMVDSSNYVWILFSTTSGNNPANSLIFLGNIGGIGATSSISNVFVWKGYLFVMRGSGSNTFDYAEAQDVYFTGPAASWNYAWSSVDVSINFPKVLLSQEDENVYFISDVGIGSLIEEPGTTFDPADSNTYTITAEALLIPGNDQGTCLGELGSNLYIGGTMSYIYVWDKVSIGFSQILTAPESFARFIIGTDQNIFIFTGNRGRIYISNGASIDLFKKIPDYVTGITNPYITWRDASYGRNQLYCGFTASSNVGTTLTSTAGAWAIDIDTRALRLLNKITNSGYSGSTNMVVQMPKSSVTSVADSANAVGSGIVMGWNISSTSYGVDVPDDEPYQALESYIDTDMIPVGTYLNPLSPSQIEWKTSVPLGANGTAETITVYYRTNLFDSFTLLGTTTATGTSVVGSTTGTTTTSAVSDYYQANFQKAQWVQFRVAMSSNATTPTYNRLTELRIRDFTAS